MPDRTLRILAVDDVPQNLTALVAGLDQPGVEIVTVPSAVEALELMLEQDFVLALLDVQMPGMDGFQLAEAMRGTERTRHIPIIFLTAVATDERRRFRGFETGAVDYLLKPLDLYILNRKVAVFIELARQRQELQLQRDQLGVALSRVRAHADTSLLAVLELDQHFRISGWAKGAERSFGHGADQMLGMAIAAAPFVPEAGREEFAATIAARAAQEASGLFEHEFFGPDGKVRCGEWHFSVVRSARANPHSVILQVLDITDRQRARKTQDLLIGELSHRVKNTMATIQAIANQTFKHTPDPALFCSAFGGRVRSLSMAHNILSAGSWESAALAELIADQLAIGAVDPARFHSSGPAAYLAPEMALRLALVLHEMVTNAVKYGAFSNDTGTISCTWVVQGETVLIDWLETGGPVLSPPIRRGFGTRLIQQSMSPEYGSAKVEYPEQGLRCRLAIPVLSATQDGGPSDAAAAPAGKPVPSAAPPRPSAMRVLVVEDEPLVAMEILMELESFGHSPIGAAATVGLALLAIEQHTPDFVLLDGNLNGEPVDKVADLLAEMGIPFAFVSGYGAEQLPQGHRSRPLVAKPFSPEDLRAVLA